MGQEERVATIEDFQKVYDELSSRERSDTIVMRMETAEVVLAASGGVLNKNKRRRIMRRFKNREPYETEFPEGIARYFENTGRRPKST